jgi:arylformamidase
MIYDITPPITPKLAVWPGDTPPSREVLCDLNRGDTVTLSTLRATVHLGAHADGPNHYGRDAADIASRNLELYLGLCQVARVNAPRGQRVRLDRIEIKAERFLLGTSTFPNPEEFNTDFAAYDPAFIDWLHERGVRLIGIDTPSIDLFDSKDLPSHKMVLKHDMAILEGLRLDHVPDGLYELIALPLKLVGFDASPLRAVLRELATDEHR